MNSGYSARLLPLRELSSYIKYKEKKPVQSVATGSELNAYPRLVLQLDRKIHGECFEEQLKMAIVKCDAKIEIIKSVNYRTQGSTGAKFIMLWFNHDDGWDRTLPRRCSSMSEVSQAWECIAPSAECL